MKLVYILALTTVLSGCEMDSKTGGTLLGSAGGAAIGAAVGRGWGGAVIGAMVGGIAGNLIGGAMSKKDKVVMETESQYALESGHRRSWRGERSHGWVEPGEMTRDRRGYYCREFTQEIIIDGKKQTIVNRACRIDRNPDGSGVWVLEENVDKYLSNADRRPVDDSYGRRYRGREYYNEGPARAYDRYEY